MPTTTPGIHLFMAIYGLSVFLETPELQKKGRKRYIAASFVITALSALSASLDMAHYFQALFKSISPGHWQELMEITFNEDWKYFLSATGVGLVTMIGDALLVRAVPLVFFSRPARLTDRWLQVYRCYIVCVEYWWVTILPTIMTLSALGMCRVRFKVQLC